MLGAFMVLVSRLAVILDLSTYFDSHGLAIPKTFQPSHDRNDCTQLDICHYTNLH